MWNVRESQKCGSFLLGCDVSEESSAAAPEMQGLRVGNMDWNEAVLQYAVLCTQVILKYL